MNKNISIMGIVLIGCVITLIGSSLIWNARIESVAGQTTLVSMKNKIEKSEKGKTSKVDDSQKMVPLNQKEIDVLTANMTDDVRAVVRSRLSEGEKVQILLIGSSSIKDGNPGYGELVTTQLSEAYGDWFEPTTIVFDGNTAALIEQMDGEIIDWSNQYDLVLLEGMNLKNNGTVIVEDAVEHIETFNAKMKETVEDAVLIVHPSQPLARAIYYPTEVEAFKMYVTSRGFAYIDHWANWTVGDEAEMNTYLTAESTPNNKGAVLWATALSRFLTGQ